MIVRLMMSKHWYSDLGTIYANSLLERPVLVFGNNTASGFQYLGNFKIIRGGIIGGIIGK